MSCHATEDRGAAGWSAENGERWEHVVWRSVGQLSM